MLPTAARLRDSREFRSIVRHGVRAGRSTLVVHADLVDPTPPEQGAGQGSAKVGFVVSKKVGNAVMRNRVKRRLRHIVRDRLTSQPVNDGLRVVVRALPDAARQPRKLASDLDSAWHTCEKRLGLGASSPSSSSRDASAPGASKSAADPASAGLTSADLASAGNAR